MWSGYSGQGTGSAERGPASFVLQQPGVVQAGAAGPQATQVRGGIQGGAYNAPINSPGLGQAQDRTASTLFKMGEEIIAPQLNRIKDEQFLQGVQQAASGKALVDIDRDQPWYTKIFGDTPLIEGARAFEVSTRASKWAAEQQLNMGKLREISPDALPKLILESTNQLMTGDVAGDMQLRAEVMKRLPGLIEQQTKERYKWGQENLRIKKHESIIANGTETQQVLSNPDPAISSPEARAAARDRVFEAYVPPPGMDEAAAERMVIDGTIANAEAGNWYAVGILQEAGVFKQLPPEKRNQLENQLRIYADRHRTQSADALPFNIKAAGLLEKAQNDTSYTADQYLADAQMLNDEFTKQTGNPSALVSNLEQARGAATAVQAVYNMMRAVQKAVSRGKDKEVKTNMLIQETVQGRLGLVVQDPDVSKPEADKAFVLAFNGLKEVDPVNYSQKQARMVINNAASGGYINPRLKAEWTSSLNALSPDQPTTAFLNTYSKWAELRKHPDSAAAREGYFGSEMDARLERYSSLMAGTPDAAISNYRAAMLSPMKRATLTKEDKTSIGSFIDQQVGRYFWIGDRLPLGTDITETARRTLIDAMKTEAETYKGMSPEIGMDEIAKRALAGVRKKGIEVIGGHAVRGVPGQVDITVRTGMDPGMLDEAFKAVLKKNAPDAGDIPLVRLADDGNRAAFEGWYRDEKQRTRRIYFTSDDLKQYETDKRLNKLKPLDLEFGPAITFPPPDARSPYNRNQR